MHTTSRRTLLGAGAGLAALGAPRLARAQAWRPERPVNIIVPWSAGGSTDQVNRVVAGELERVWGQRIVVVNQPGASGTIGTKAVLDAPRDGYTWKGASATDLGTYQVTGQLDTDIRQWTPFMAVANFPVVGVNAGRPWRTLPELIEAFKARPGQISVATAGVASTSHAAIEAIRLATGIQYRHVPYQGGAPASTATAGGEADLTLQLAVEQSEFIRAGRIRALAVFHDRPLEIEGAPPIPPITQFIPNLETNPFYFGIFLPPGTPQPVVDSLTQVWNTEIRNSTVLRNYALSRGAAPAVMAGAEAWTVLEPTIRRQVWRMHEGGRARVDPASLGWARP